VSYDIPTYIIFNKSDLYNQDDLNYYKELSNMYHNAGFTTLLASADTGFGIDDLKKILKGKTTLFSGHSGVGKSSLINSIQTGLELKTGDISDINDKGMHTTTFAEMFELEFGGRIIDTPGIKELGFLNMEPSDVGHNVPEIFNLSKNCKFANCMHINEPKCAVKDAIDDGSLHPLRYQSYLSIMDEVMDQNYWERQKD
jgi:ribosome biogenesis GTPase